MTVANLALIRKTMADLGFIRRFFRRWKDAKGLRIQLEKKKAQQAAETARQQSEGMRPPVPLPLPHACPCCCVLPLLTQ